MCGEGCTGQWSTDTFYLTETMLTEVVFFFFKKNIKNSGCQPV